MSRRTVLTSCRKQTVLGWALSFCLAAVAGPACCAADQFIVHAIKPPRPGADGNTVPSMVWLDDADRDGRVDLIATHVAWMTAKGYVHPYTALVQGPGVPARIRE